MYNTEETVNHGQNTEQQQCTNVPLGRSNLNATTNCATTKSSPKSSTTSVLRSWRRPDTHDNIPKQTQTKETGQHGKYINKNLEPGSEIDKQMNLNTNYCANSDNSNSSSVQSDYSVYGSQLSPIVPQSTARPYVDSAKYFPHVQYAEGAGAYSRASPVLSSTQSKDIRQAGNSATKYYGTNQYYQQDGTNHQEAQFRSPLYPSQEIPPMAHKASQNANKVMHYTNFPPKDQRQAREYFPVQKPPSNDPKSPQQPADDSRYCLPKPPGYIQENRDSPHNSATSSYSYTSSNVIDRRIPPQETKSPIYRNYPGQNVSAIVDSRINPSAQNSDQLSQSNNSYCMEKTVCVAQEQQKQGMDRFAYRQNCQVQKLGMVNTQDPKYGRDCRNVISHAPKKPSAPFPILEQRLNQQETNFCADYSSQSFMYHKFSTIMMPRSSPTSKLNREGPVINYGAQQKLPTQEVMLPPNYALQGKYYPPVQNQEWKREYEQNLYLNQMSQMHARLPQNVASRISDQPRDLSYVEQNRAALQKSRAHLPESYPIDPAQYTSKQIGPGNQKPAKVNYGIPEDRLTANEYSRTYGTILKQAEYAQPSVLQMGKESNYDSKLSREYLMHQQAYRGEVQHEQQNFMTSPSLAGQNSRNIPAYQHLQRQVPPRNISPRRTFQENMPVTVIPPHHIGLPKISPSQYPDYLNPQIYPGYFPRDTMYPPANSKPGMCQYLVDPTTKYPNRCYSQQRFHTEYPEHQYFPPKHSESNDKVNYYADRAHYNLQQNMIQNSDREFVDAAYQNIPGAYRSCIATKEVSAEYAKKESELGKSLKEFLESWEDDEEIVANLPDLVLCNNIPPRQVTFADPISKETLIPSRKDAKDNQSDDQSDEALYILDSTNISTEALPQYLHIQQIDRLPDNIKGYYKTSSSESTEDEKEEIPEVDKALGNEARSSPQNYSMVSKEDDLNMEQSSPQNYSTKSVCSDDGQALNLSTNRNKENEEFLTEEYQATSDDDSVKVQTDHTEKNSREATIFDTPRASSKLMDSSTTVEELKTIQNPEDICEGRHLKEGDTCVLFIDVDETTILKLQKKTIITEEASDKHERENDEDIEEITIKPSESVIENIANETRKPVTASVIVPNMFLECNDDKFTHSNLEPACMPDNIFPDDCLDIPEVKNEVLDELVAQEMPNQIGTTTDSLMHEEIENTSSKCIADSIIKEEITPNKVVKTVDNLINEEYKDTGCTDDSIVGEMIITTQDDNMTEPAEPASNNKADHAVSEVMEIEINNSECIETLSENPALSTDTESDAKDMLDTNVVIQENLLVNNEVEVFKESSEIIEDDLNHLELSDTEIKNSLIVDILHKQTAGFVKAEIIKESSEENNNKANISEDTPDIVVSCNEPESSNVVITDFLEENQATLIKEESNNSNSCFSDSTVSLSAAEIGDVNEYTHINSNETLFDDQSENSDSDSSVFQNEPTSREVNLTENDCPDSIPVSNLTVYDTTIDSEADNIIKTKQSSEKDILILKNSESISELEQSEQISSSTISAIQEIPGLDTVEAEMEEIHVQEIVPLEFEDLDLDTATPILELDTPESRIEIAVVSPPEMDVHIPELSLDIYDCHKLSIIEVPEVVFAVPEAIFEDADVIPQINSIDENDQMMAVIDVTVENVVVEDIKVEDVKVEEVKFENVIVEDIVEDVIVEDVIVETVGYDYAIFDTDEGLEDYLPTKEISTEEIETEEIPKEDRKTKEILIEKSNESQSKTAEKKDSAEGTNEILLEKELEDWVQKEEIGTVTKEELKQEELEEKKKAVFATRKKKLEIFKQHMIPAKKEKKSTDLENLTDDLPLNFKKSVLPNRVQEENKFMNPENPVFNSKPAELSLFDGTLSRKRRLSCDEFTEFKIGFRAQKRRYSTMDVVRQVKKPIINLDEISQNITEELQKISKTETPQYKEERTTKKLSNDFLCNMESIINNQTTSDTHQTHINSLNKGLIKPLEKDLTSALNNQVTDMPLQISIPEPLITGLVKQHTKTIHDPVKLNDSTASNITNTSTKSDCNIPECKNLIPNVVSIPKTFPTVSKSPPDNRKVLVPPNKQTIDPRIDKMKQEIVKFHSKPQEDLKVLILPKKHFLDLRIDKPNKIGPKLTEENVVVPKKQILDSSTDKPKQDTGKFDTKLLEETPHVVSSKKQILDPRIDKPKLDTVKLNSEPVPFVNKSNTFSLAEYTKNYIKMRTNQCVDPKIQSTNNGYKRPDPRMVKSKEDISVNNVTKLKERLIYPLSTNEVQHQEKKVKIKLEDYRNRKCSVNGVDSQDLASENLKQLFEASAATTAIGNNCNIPIEGCNKMKSKASVKDYALDSVELKSNISNQDNLIPKKYLVDQTKDSKVTNNQSANTDNHEPKTANISNNLGCTNLTKPYKLKKRRKRFRNLYTSDNDEDATSNDSAKKSRTNHGDEISELGHLKCHINLDKCGQFVKDKIQTYEINKNDYNNHLKLTLKTVKKPKPAFAEVLTKLDKAVSTELFPKKRHSNYKHNDHSDLTVPSSDSSEHSEFSWTMKNKIPKVIIKRSASGYCAIFRDVAQNPMWQPQVLVTRLSEYHVNNFLQ